MANETSAVMLKALELAQKRVQHYKLVTEKLEARRKDAFEQSDVNKMLNPNRQNMKVA